MVSFHDSDYRFPFYAVSGFITIFSQKLLSNSIKYWESYLIKLDCFPCIYKFQSNQRSHLKLLLVVIVLNPSKTKFCWGLLWKGEAWQLNMALTLK